VRSVSIIYYLKHFGLEMSDFHKIKRGDPSDLRPQDDSQRLADKYQKKDNLICHSAAVRRISYFILFFIQRVLFL